MQIQIHIYFMPKHIFLSNNNSVHYLFLEFVLKLWKVGRLFSEYCRHSEMQIGDLDVEIEIETSSPRSLNPYVASLTLLRPYPRQASDISKQNQIWQTTALISGRCFIVSRRSSLQSSL